MAVMRAQASTEYLAILAVVLVVTVVAVGLLGQFSDFNRIGMEQQSISYWQSASPFAIQNIRIHGNLVYMDVRNGVSQKLNLTNISFNGVDIHAGVGRFSSGQTITMNGTIAGFNCSVNEPYEFKTIVFTYTQGSVGGLTETGDRSLLGRCT